MAEEKAKPVLSRSESGPVLELLHVEHESQDGRCRPGDKDSRLIESPPSNQACTTYAKQKDQELKPVVDTPHVPSEHLCHLVDFEDGSDQANPLKWKPSYRWTVIVLISLMTMIMNISTYICAPAILEMQIALDANSDLYGTLLICIFGLGNVCGPLLIAPLSEIYGRRIVYHVANSLFVVFSLATGFTTSIAAAVIIRFLTAASAASLALNPPIVGDLFAKEKRGTAMVLMSIMPLFGTAIGPVIGGFIAANLNWKWTFWIQAIITAAVAIALALALRETYSVRILTKRAHMMRQQTGDTNFRSRFDHDSSISPAKIFRRAMVRPLVFLCNSWPLVLVSVYAASVFGLSYVTLTTILFVFPNQYGFSPEYVGLVYLGVAVGMAAGTLFCGLVLDRLLRRAKERGDGGPEARLQATMLAVILVPAGLLLYGWPSEYRLHWIVPIIGIAIQSMGLAIASVTSLNYVVDAFGIYAASASAILSVSRYVVATLLPLAAPPLVSAIGNGWTNTALAGIALATAPVPFVLVRYGKGMRERGQLRVDDS